MTLNDQISHTATTVPTPYQLHIVELPGVQLLQSLIGFSRNRKRYSLQCLMLGVHAHVSLHLRITDLIHSQSFGIWGHEMAKT